MRLLLIVFLVVFPSVTKAVMIHEIAWMGDVYSANHEWIELYNNSDTVVTVTDWVLSDGMNLNITLEGAIPANSYAVLERTSDESAAGNAFLIYTGALVNTGAILTLKRSDGSVVDQVAGGENWDVVGGDNVTKETAQYTSSGWVTAPATPGKENATEGSSQSVTIKTSGAPLATPSKRVNTETVKLILPDVTLQLEIDTQSLGYVNQEINFAANASEIGDTLIDSLEYEWNFGDGQVGRGELLAHKYPYPGTYVVTVYASYKRQKQAARQEITILPVKLSLTRNNRNDIQVNNNSPYELDISKYVIRAGKTFVFPSRSIILPNQTITIPLEKIGLEKASVYDNSGLQITTEEVAVQEHVIYTPSFTPTPITLNKDTQFNFSNTEEEVTEQSIASSSAENAALLISATKDSKEENDSLPYLGLLGIIGLGTIGALAKPKRN